MVVVVVVGASVVVVVVGASVVVVVVGAATDEVPPELVGDVEVVVVVGAAVVEVEVEVEVEVVEVDDPAPALVAPLAPGCSLATTTPITAEAPVADRMAARVNRRRRT